MQYYSTDLTDIQYGAILRFFSDKRKHSHSWREIMNVIFFDLIVKIMLADNT
jgi:hypothetical protein